MTFSVDGKTYLGYIPLVLNETLVPWNAHSCDRRK